jgi:ribosomal protein S18 acetylase RimI-like enzyme
VRPEEYAGVGELVVDAYAVITPDVDYARDDLTAYEDELRDVAGRAAAADVLVAVDGEGTILGSVTYVPDHRSPAAEFDDPDAAGIRMLAVAAAAQRRGVGEALTVACIDRATAAGRTWLVLHSTEWMTAAHRLYGRLGFARDPERDIEVNPQFVLRAFRLRLTG